MIFGKRPHPYPNHSAYEPPEDVDEGRPVPSEHSGEEANYLKSLVDSRARVTVFLKTGESYSGRIRYYDRYCFSLGQAGGPKLFLRKENVQSIREE
jgi:sRNA-binding regulator protein Hfq